MNIKKTVSSIALLLITIMLSACSTNTPSAPGASVSSDSSYTATSVVVKNDSSILFNPELVNQDNYVYVVEGYEYRFYDKRIEYYVGGYLSNIEDSNDKIIVSKIKTPDGKITESEGGKTLLLPESFSANDKPYEITFTNLIDDTENTLNIQCLSLADTLKRTPTFSFKEFIIDNNANFLKAEDDKTYDENGVKIEICTCRDYSELLKDYVNLDSTTTVLAPNNSDSTNLTDSELYLFRKIDEYLISDPLTGYSQVMYVNLYNYADISEDMVMVPTRDKIYNIPVKNCEALQDISVTTEWVDNYGHAFFYRDLYDDLCYSLLRYLEDYKDPNKGECYRIEDIISATMGMTITKGDGLYGFTINMETIDENFTVYVILNPSPEKYSIEDSYFNFSFNSFNMEQYGLLGVSGE